MEKKLRVALAEVDEVLSMIEKEHLEKIPKNVRDFIKAEKEKEYKSKICSDVPLDKQNLHDETLAILAAISIEYWCESEKEKQELLREYKMNELKNEKNLKEKYDPNRLFIKKAKDDENIGNEKKELSMIEYKKDNFFQRIIKKIMKIIKR